MITNSASPSQINSALPRPEYPRPQFVRENWLCLNGPWQFELDPNDSGIDRGVQNRELSSSIVVPFCVESTLSGIGDTDFHAAVWYRRTVTLPAEWASFPRLRLHFQACDFETTVWVNGIEVARHRGGFTPFFAEIGSCVNAQREITIVVRARDNNRMSIPEGKQSGDYANQNCMYTRTTGIWQTVWLEPLPATALERVRITPDVANSRFKIEAPLSGNASGLTLKATLSDEQGVVTTASVSADYDFAPSLDLSIPSDRLHLWEPGNPFLYDITFELVDAQGCCVDTLQSYAGLRAIRIDGLAVKINGKSVFQRQVLDQGYYPDGILTAPSDEALIRDIQLSMDAGFNAARLHQKVFEERFLYHADRLGYLVWGEFGDWGVLWNQESIVPTQLQPGATLIAQWQEALIRDYSHPSIIGWCPINESWQHITDRMSALDDMTTGTYFSTKACDRSRPVLDASGYAHRVRGADIYDCHNYNQNPELFQKDFEDAEKQNSVWANLGHNGRAISVPYAGQPYFCSEFGGIKWNPAIERNEGHESWGYGDTPKTLEEFYQRFEGLCAVLLNNPKMFAYCYTQLTDVFQEQNGIYHFDRTPKFDLERIRKAQTQVAAIEH